MYEANQKTAWGLQEVLMKNNLKEVNKVIYGGGNEKFSYIKG